MKKTTLLLFAFGICLSSQFAYSAPDASGDESPLEEQMEAMNKSWKTVRRAVKDPSQYASAAGLVASMIEHANKATEMEPALLAEVEGAEAKKAFVEGYRKGMKETVEMLGQLRTALEAGDQASAEALVGKLNDARKKGHNDYKADDD